MTHKIEVPVTIPGKIIILPGKPVLVVDTSRSAHEDSLITAMAEQDKLDSLARWRGQKFQAIFEDTLAVKDSLGEFYTKEIHTITVDGATQLIEKAVKYVDSKLTAYKTIVTEVEYQNNYWAYTLVLLVGIIVGILL